MIPGAVIRLGPAAGENQKNAGVFAHMKRYIALLRGINISGKNKIPMAELKKEFENLGLEEVKTYLNSGNVVFSSSEDDTNRHTALVEEMIQSRFGLDIPVFVIAQEALADILHNAPEWWGNDGREIYDNLIFILPPATFSDVYEEIGAPKEGLEQIANYKEAIFWSFSRKEYQKTNWWSRTASAKIASGLTIRTANTVRKLAVL